MWFHFESQVLSEKKHSCMRKVKNKGSAESVASSCPQHFKAANITCSIVAFCNKASLMVTLTCDCCKAFHCCNGVAGTTPPFGEGNEGTKRMRLQELGMSIMYRSADKTSKNTSSPSAGSACAFYHPYNRRDAGGVIFYTFRRPIKENRT